MTAWILYALGVSAGITMAGVLGEGFMKGWELPTRWVWAAAMVLSVGLPVASALTPKDTAVEPDEAVMQLQASPSGGTSLPDTGGSHWWDRVPADWSRMGSSFVPVWVLASAMMGSLLILVTLGLYLRSRRWPRIRLPQGEALLSERFGPALLGGIPARVVIPRWALGLGPAAVEMIMTHEAEHRRAGDANLLLAGALAAAVVPWNPFVWYQLRRLRTAVELDCDARVLRRGVPRISYAELLLRVGARPGDRLVPWAALAAEPSLLERRLTMIVRGRENMGRRRAALAGVVSAGLVAMACGAEAPPLTPDTPDAAAQFSEQAQMEKKAVAGRVAERAMGAFQLRGVGGDPLVLLDGTRVTKADLADLDVSTIARIEVVKGEAALAQFGPEAEGGVIQIFLMEPGGEGADQAR